MTKIQEKSVQQGILPCWLRPTQVWPDPFDGGYHLRQHRFATAGRYSERWQAWERSLVLFAELNGQFG